MKKATVLPVGVSKGGVLHGAVQHEDRSVTLGVFRPLREGQPITDPAGVCEVRDRPGTPFLDATFPFAEETAPAASVEPAAPSSGGRKGPAKVNSEGYRAAWDRIFGSTSEPGEA